DQLQSRLDDPGHNHILVLSDDQSKPVGYIRRNDLFEKEFSPLQKVGTIVRKKIYSVFHDNSLRLALEFMLKTGQDFLPVIDKASGHLVGVVTERDILKAFAQRFHEEKHMERHISIKNQTTLILKKGQRFLKPKKKSD